MKSFKSYENCYYFQICINFSKIFCRPFEVLKLIRENIYKVIMATIDFSPFLDHVFTENKLEMYFIEWNIIKFISFINLNNTIP